MKYRNKWTAALVIFLVLAFTIPNTAFAFGKRGHHNRGFGKGFGGGFGLHFIMSLGLNAEQKKQVAAILKNHKTEIKSNVDEFVKVRQEMAAKLHAANTTEAELREASKKVSAVKEEMVILRWKIRSEIMTILSAEQISAFEEKRNLRQSRMQDRHERRWERFETFLQELEG